MCACRRTWMSAAEELRRPALKKSSGKCSAVCKYAMRLKPLTVLLWRHKQSKSASYALGIAPFNRGNLTL